MLTVSLPPDVQATLRTALLRAGTRECGGVLMGEHIGVNHFAVRALTVQGGGTFARFVREASSAIRMLRMYFAHANHDYTRFNYLGEWHSHPSFSTQPSTRDHESMRALASDPSVGANFLVLLIIRIDDRCLDGSAHVYLPDGAVHEATLAFEGGLL
jgi:integrative and conjugative element protein (TIGR02256 family)